MASNRFTLPTLLLAFGLSSVLARAQTSSAGLVTNSHSTNAAGDSTNAAEQVAEAKPTLKEIQLGVYEIGSVRLDKARRTVSFPAVLNLTHGPMEYFLVTSWGKTHESILRTDAEPRLIHAAMLILGAQGARKNGDASPESGNGADLNEGQFLSQPSVKRLSGDEISLAVAWALNGKQVQKPADILVLNRTKNSPLPKRSWIYNGSRLVDGAFVADMDGSVVSLITDTSALINNVAPGHEDDAIWIANTNALPPADTPLEITITLGDSSHPGVSSISADRERPFRLILLAGFICFMPIGIYHRLRARTGEKLDRMQEGIFILVTLRLVAAVAMGGLIAYLINPANVAWAAVPLPVWLRWMGVPVGALAVATFTWTLHTLGRNLTDTVVTRKAHTMVTAGPYRWVRHPFYSSAALLILANSLITANGFLFATSSLIFLLLVIRTRKEEENLVARFGVAYQDYMKRTGRFVPRW